jgi:hypothetical protein
MRKWLFLLLGLAILYALSLLNTKKRRAKFPFLKRVDRAITILVWVLLAAYGFSFCFWVYTKFIR